MSRRPVRGHPDEILGDADGAAACGRPVDGSSTWLVDGVDRGQQAFGPADPDATAPVAMSPPPPRIPSGTVICGRLSPGSTLVTEPSAQLSVQTAPSPAARKRGSGPGSHRRGDAIRQRDRSAGPSPARDDRPSAVFVIHTASAAKGGANTTAGRTSIRATDLIRRGIDARQDVPCLGLSTQMESAPAARLSSPVGSASPVGMRATTVLRLAIDPIDRRDPCSSATQSEPTATTIAPQGPGIADRRDRVGSVDFELLDAIGIRRPDRRVRRPPGSRRSRGRVSVAMRHSAIATLDRRSSGPRSGHFGPWVATYSATIGPSCSWTQAVISLSLALQ